MRSGGSGAVCGECPRAATARGRTGDPAWSRDDVSPGGEAGVATGWICRDATVGCTDATRRCGASGSVGQLGCELPESDWRAWPAGKGDVRTRPGRDAARGAVEQAALQA